MSDCLENQVGAFKEKLAAASATVRVEQAYGEIVKMITDELGVDVLGGKSQEGMYGMFGTSWGVTSPGLRKYVLHLGAICRQSYPTNCVVYIYFDRIYDKNERAVSNLARSLLEHYEFRAESDGTFEVDMAVVNKVIQRAKYLKDGRVVSRMKIPDVQRREKYWTWYDYVENAGPDLVFEPFNNTEFDEWFGKFEGKDQLPFKDYNKYTDRFDGGYQSHRYDILYGWLEQRTLTGEDADVH